MDSLNGNLEQKVQTWINDEIMRSLMGTFFAETPLTVMAGLQEVAFRVAKEVVFEKKGQKINVLESLDEKVSNMGRVILLSLVHLRETYGPQKDRMFSKETFISTSTAEERSTVADLMGMIYPRVLDDLMVTEEGSIEEAMKNLESIG